MSALVCAIASALLSGSPAWASDPFPVQETFRGPSFGSQWRHGGSAELTGAQEAEGWLRLTSAAGGEFGYTYDDEAFPSADGALVEFEYADWGGSGADGLTFFLFNGSTSETEFHAGQPGGALGYASCNNSSDGLTNAYVGVGFDEYGNFTNLGSICGLDGTEFLPNHVSIRGSAGESYKLLATAPTSESLRAERSQARRVTIAITPTGKLSVYIRYPDGTYQQVSEGFQLPVAPETLKFGYVASTGALTDDHEIRDAEVVKPTQLTPTVTQTGGGDERGEPLTWTAVVRNEGPNPTQREQVNAATGAQSLENVSWTCQATGGAECVTATGTGLPSSQAGAMPDGSTLTYRITGTPTPTTDYAQLTVESEPRGDTGELDPEKERATATTDLTPLFAQAPSFTLAADGEASATTVSARGVELSYSYAWQRCEAGGTVCADIAGAEALTYQTTAADAGHTIRFTETATDAAGSATVDSAVYRPLPTAEITSAPAHFFASREARLAFTASTAEATLECSLDGAAWSVCASPMFYPGLADGEHTFSVRAAYGGLSDPDPASVRWIIQVIPPPTAPVSSAAPEGAPAGSGTTPPPGSAQANAGTTSANAATTPARAGASATTHDSRLAATHVRKTGRGRPAVKQGSKVKAGQHPGAGKPGAGKSRHTVRRRATTRHGAKRRGRQRRRHRAKRRGRHRRRHQAKRRRRVKRRRGSARRHTTTHRRKAAPRRHVTKRTAETPPDRVTPPPSAKAPQGRAAPPLTGKAPVPVAAPEPKVKTPPPAHARKQRRKIPPTAPTDKRTKVKTAPATAEPQPEINSPGPAGTPTSTREPSRHSGKHGRHAKAPPATTPKPTPGTGRKREGKAQAPSTEPSPKGKTRARARRHATRREAPAPHARRAPRARARHRARGVGSVPVIRPFRPRSAALVGRARRRVERLAAALANARRVVCVGYTDDLGSPSANLALGLGRARAVCAKLRALGLRAVFKVESRGERRPCASNATARGRALNRRVELRVTY